MPEPENVAADGEFRAMTQPRGPRINRETRKETGPTRSADLSNRSIRKAAAPKDQAEEELEKCWIMRHV